MQFIGLKPSWVMSHYSMLYKIQLYDKHVWDLLGLFCLFFLVLVVFILGMFLNNK